MKQKLLKTWLMLVLMLVGAGTTWAEDATKTEGFEKATAATNYQSTIDVEDTQSDCSIAWEIYYGNVTTSSAISGSNSVGLRLYSSNNYGYLESKTAVENLKSISFDAKAATSNGAKIKFNVQTSADGSSWTDVATEVAPGTSSSNYKYSVTSGHKFVKISISSKSTKPTKSGTQLTIDNFKFTYSNSDDPAPDKELIAIQADGTPAEFWKGDAFNHNGITVTALWDDEKETDVTSSCQFSGYDMSTAGKQTVTVKYQGETCTYDIEVKTIANTQETAYTVTEAKALIDAGKDLATQVYVAGTVSSLGANKDGENAYNDTYKSITYWLDENTFEVYSGKNLNNTDFSSAEELMVGDQVVIYGVIKKYSSIYEFDKNNYIVSLTHPTAKTITALAVSGTPTKTTYNVGDAFETAGLTVTATYSDASTATITTGFDWEIDYGTGNEALVEGATSVDVMAYIGDDVMSEVYTVNGLTVTVPVTLTSIAVSGTPTKTEYYAGDAFETAGLVVTGHYSDGSDEVITEGIEWTFDPETLALETTSVEVLACVGSVVSEVYTVNGLTVTKPDFETVTYNFSEFTSGQSVELTDLDGFVITLKSNGGTNPAWASSQARVYAKGSLTVKANNATIKSIEYVYTVNKNNKGVTPTIDGVEGTTDAGSWDVENKTWTGADEEVTFSTSGTAGNIGFTKLIIKYVESSKITPTLSFSAPTAEVTIGANDNVFPTLTTTPADLEGVTFESSNTAVATINENTGAITLVAAGETIITAKYAGNEDYAAATPATYTLTVKKASFVPTPVEEGYEVVDFKNVVYSSLTGNETATIEEYEGTSFAMAFAKPQSSSTPTKYYANGTSVRAYEGNTITITGAENITYVDIAWVTGYVDDAVSITGLGTTTVVVTFSKKCRFTAISVDYRSATIVIASACTDGKKYYSTYSNASSWVVPENLTVSEIGIEDGALSVKPYKTGDVVPANTGVMVSAATGDNYTVALTTNVGAHPADVTNALRPTCAGITAADMAAADADCTYYRLTMHNGTQIGFWWGAADGAAFSLGANKAYMAIPNSAGVKANTLWFDTTTGIKTIENAEESDMLYNLAGQRVHKAVRGIYVKNGKKYIVK